MRHLPRCPNLRGSLDVCRWCASARCPGDVYIFCEFVTFHVQVILISRDPSFCCIPVGLRQSMLTACVPLFLKLLAHVESGAIQSSVLLLMGSAQAIHGPNQKQPNFWLVPSLMVGVNNHTLAPAWKSFHSL